MRNYLCVPSVINYSSFNASHPSPFLRIDLSIGFSGADIFLCPMLEIYSDTKHSYIVGLFRSIFLQLLQILRRYAAEFFLEALPEVEQIVDVYFV